MSPKAHSKRRATYLRLANDLEYASDRSLNKDAEEVGKLLGAYTRSILSSSS